jgi:hypothetical protein
MTLDDFPVALAVEEKRRRLLEAANELTRHHRARCPEYRRILDAMWPGDMPARSLAEVPFLPVGVFKELDLASTEVPTIVLRSSGTSSQRPSRIHVDAETSERQSRALIETFRPVIGSGRLPFLVIDTKDSISDRTMLTARGAGILGLMKFGAHPTFALDGELCVSRAEVQRFLERFGSRPFLIFGFTYLVWTALYEAYRDGEIDLSQAMLIHSGGWKKMEDRKVDNPRFRAAMAERFGISRIHNFYGFVEQIGSIFVEGEAGLLRPPPFAEVLIRDPDSGGIQPPGRSGLIQLISALPRSYPGHSILTEDLGLLERADSGVGLRVLGRVPAAELRGCSDVIAAGAQ